MQHTTTTHPPIKLFEVSQNILEYSRTFSNKNPDPVVDEFCQTWVLDLSNHFIMFQLLYQLVTEPRTISPILTIVNIWLIASSSKSQNLGSMVSFSKRLSKGYKPFGHNRKHWAMSPILASESSLGLLASSLLL